jgi:excisionase family DNA binding protein
MMTTDLLTAQQVQELLHVDKSTIYRMASDGRLPAVKVGKQWRFPADAIAELVGANATTTGTTEQRPTIDPAAAESVVEVMAERLGVMMVVTDLEGHPVTSITNPSDWMKGHDGDPTVIQTCVDEWRELAADVDLSPRLRKGRLGFECARVFIRHEHSLVGMVLAGGISPAGDPHPEFHHLDDVARRRLLDTLPMVAALVGRVAVADQDISSESQRSKE